MNKENKNVGDEGTCIDVNSIVNLLIDVRKHSFK
jgi:hypothetical protein